MRAARSLQRFEPRDGLSFKSEGSELLTLAGLADERSKPFADYQVSTRIHLRREGGTFTAFHRF